MTNKEKFKVGVIGATGMVGQRMTSIVLPENPDIQADS